MSTPHDPGDGQRERVRAGDRDAFAELYDEHARAVFNHALRLTGNWSTAEDVTSETFLAAWRTREAVLAEGGPLHPWLLGIATHQAMNSTRGARRRVAFLAGRPAPRPVDDIAELTAGRVDDARRLASARRALRLLTRPEVEVLALCVWSGLSYAEAAEALDVPVGTVRSRLSRARARLRSLTDQQLSRDASSVLTRHPQEEI